MKSTPLKHSVKHEASGVKKLKNETDGNTVYQIREKHKALKNVATLYLET